METGNNGATSAREVEVAAKAERRRFTAEYKLRVLRDADDCKQAGQIGALLRREGLYWSNLTHWRRQRESGELAGLTGKRRGPQHREKNPLAERVRELERDNVRLKRRAERAEGLVELQKKSRRFWGSNCKRAPSKIDGDGKRAQGVEFSPIDLRGVGGRSGQLLPAATTEFATCNRPRASSGVVDGRAGQRTGGSQQ